MRDGRVIERWVFTPAADEGQRGTCSEVGKRKEGEHLANPGAAREGGEGLFGLSAVVMRRGHDCSCIDGGRVFRDGHRAAYPRASRATGRIAEPTVRRPRRPPWASTKRSLFQS